MKKDSLKKNNTKKDTSRKNVKNSKNVKKEEIITTNNSKSSYKLYFGFNTRVFIYSILSLLFLFISLLFIVKSFYVKNAKDVNYQENSNLDYKVYLKKNDFYENDYLGKDMVYVASLIDKIGIDFNYLFRLDKNSSIDFNYDVVGKLVITDTEEEKTFYEKEYILVKNTLESINDQSNYNLSKNVSIDYDYYNDLANKFRIRYGVDTKSNLIVYLKINEKDSKGNDFKFNNTSIMSITIPLSQKAINIKMDYRDINKKNKIISDSFVIVNNSFYIIVSILFVILSIYYCIRVLRLLGLNKSKKSKYDKYISKLLNEYDRLIVETKTLPDLKNSRVVRIDSFQELLDVRDNLKLPIKYCVINEHQKCNFYINHMDELYLLVVKAIDLEK